MYEQEMTSDTDQLMWDDTFFSWVKRYALKDVERQRILLVEG